MKEELIQELKERLEFYERHKRSFPGEADWADSKIELSLQILIRIVAKKISCVFTNHYGKEGGVFAD